MTMQDLYDEMKSVLAFFGVRFHDMSEVTVTMMPQGTLRFVCNDQEIHIKVPQ